MTKPRQGYMEADDLSRLEAWSRRRGWSKSQTVRAAVRALVRRPDDVPLLAASGMIEGLPPDLSAHVDRYLQETFVAKPPQASPRKRRSTRESLRR